MLHGIIFKNLWAIFQENLSLGQFLKGFKVLAGKIWAYPVHF